MPNDDPAPTSDDGPQPASCDIQLQNPCRYPEVGARRLRPWLEPMVAELAPEAESFGVRFVSDREMRRLNASYRSKDKTTDVLSFPGDLADSSDADSSDADSSDADSSNAAWVGVPDLGAHLGDVVVSVPTARRQAATAGHSAEREVRVLLLHGVLHCLGYDHETDDGTMERLEAGLRERFIGSNDGVVP